MWGKVRGKVMRLIFAFVLSFLLASHAWATNYQYKLYFGLSKPDGGAVSMAEWEAYQVEFAKVFAGFNVAETTGFYLSIKERSRIITLFADDCREGELKAIVRTYVTRFGQDSVLVAKAPIENWELIKKDSTQVMHDSCSAN